MPWEVKPCQRQTSQQYLRVRADKDGRDSCGGVNSSEGAPLYVLHADIERYGPTETCTACAEIGLGGRNKTPHSEECRQRIAEVMAGDEDSKVRARYQWKSEENNQVQPEETAEDAPGERKDVEMEDDGGQQLN